MRRWEDNTGMDLGDIVWEIMYWIHVAQDTEQWRALLNAVMNLWVP
jgi:hypothetical protein